MWSIVCLSIWRWGKLTTWPEWNLPLPKGSCGSRHTVACLGFDQWTWAGWTIIGCVVFPGLSPRKGEEATFNWLKVATRCAILGRHRPKTPTVRPLWQNIGLCLKNILHRTVVRVWKTHHILTRSEILQCLVDYLKMQQIDKQQQMK